MLEAIVAAVSALGQGSVILMLLLGVIVGLIFGALPGLSGVTALALVIPFTYGWEHGMAMYFFTGIMGACTFGGSIPAILLNTPGMAPNAATCFDGYPMAQRGEAKKALAISATASGLGAMVGVAVLTMLIPIMHEIIMHFGAPEVLMVILFGLFSVAFAARGNMLKGLIAGGVGIFFSLIGMSEVFGVTRFTIGSYYLWDGLSLIPFLIGIFAVNELLNFSLVGGTVAKTGFLIKGSTIEGIKEVFRHKICFFRSSLIGTGVGIVPGVGGTVANFLSYVTAMQMSKQSETFGQGNPEGVVASESANNAKDGGALLPTVAFGIPGSAEMAVLLGAFVLHGLNPGPLLFTEHLDIVFMLVIGLVLANIITSVSGLVLAEYLARVSTISVYYIIPVLTTICLAAAFALRNNIWDVLLTTFAGILGYTFRKAGFPVIPFIIGFILGEPAERAFHQSLSISWGSYSIFFVRPISLILLILSILMLVIAFYFGRQQGESRLEGQ